MITTPPAPLKRGFLVVLKITLWLVIAVVAGGSIALICPRILPALTRTSAEPKRQDFCGRYIPFPETARLLSEKYPGAQTWLDFKNDGTFAFNDIPRNRPGDGDHATWIETGTWRFSKYPGRIDAGEGGILPLELKGERPPYLIELWNFAYRCPMRFCKTPAQSPAVRAYAVLSIMDWVFQGIIACSILVLPFVLPEGAASRALGYPFLAMLAWGFWRMAYFDPVMGNDVPGISYIIIALFYPWVGSVIYAVRQGVQSRRNKKSKLQACPGDEA